MNSQTGDSVRITSKNTMHYGKTGEVVHVFEDEKTVTVKLEEHVNGSEFTTAGIITGFFITELEVVKGVDEEEQIARIATALIDEAGFPTAIHALEAARNLYAAGVRHHGK